MGDPSGLSMSRIFWAVPMVKDSHCSMSLGATMPRVTMFFNEQMVR